MRAHAVAVAGPGPYGTRLTTLRSEAPLLLRPTPDALYLVSGAAGPLGGDELTLDLTVRAGAALTVRTTAASLALPGRTGEPSTLRVHAVVEPGARLDYRPEPTIIAARARHRTDARLDLAPDAELTWRDELILGRYGETGGAGRSRLYADRAGRPLLRHTLDLDPADPATMGAAILQGHRAVGQVLAVGAGPAAEVPDDRTATAATMALAAPNAVLRTALASDAPSLRAALARGAQLTAARQP